MLTFRILRQLTVGLLVAWLAGGVASGDADELVGQVKEDVAWLTRRPTRVVGSDDHRRTRDELLKRIQAVPGVQVWTQDFEVIVPQGMRAALHLAGEADPHRIYPLWPANVRLNTTPAEGLDGELIYIGQGAPGVGWGHLPARSLRGQIAVMEISGGNRWRGALTGGAKAMILLGSPKADTRSFHSHLLPIPLDFPRFYVPDGPLADRLREQAKRRGKLTSQARWGAAKAMNLYALINPPRETPAQAMVIGVPLDSASVVPELAPGADGAVDVALALRALEHFSKTPPARPVLFAFVDAYGINQRGLREMLHTLAVPADDRQQKAYDESDAKGEETYQELLALVQKIDPKGDAELEQLAGLHQREFRDLHRAVKDQIAQMVVDFDYEIHLLRTDRFDIERSLRLLDNALEAPAPGDDPATLRKEQATLRTDLERLEAGLTALLTVRARHYRVQDQLITRDPLSDDPVEKALALTMWRRARQRVIAQHQDIRARIEKQSRRSTLREAIVKALGLKPEAVPVNFLLGLDLSDAGVAVGPSLWCAYLQKSEMQNAYDFGRWIEGVNQRERATLWPGRQGRAVDLTPVAGSIEPESYTLGSLPTLTAPALSFRLAAVTWATFDAVRPRSDTPYDRAEALNWERLAPQIEASLSLMRRMLADDSFRPMNRVHPIWCRVEGLVVDQAAGEPVPRLPLEGYLATVMPGGVGGGIGSMHYTPMVGVRVIEFDITRSDGRFRFDAVPSVRIDHTTTMMMHAYRLAEDGSIDRSVDMLSDGTGVRLNTNISRGAPPSLRAMVFPSEGFTIGGLFDARFLMNLTGTSLLDAERGSAPQQMNVQRHGDLAVCQLEPETRWQLILRAGIVGNRMALLNLDPAIAEPNASITMGEAMVGYTMHEPLPSIPMHLAARDFHLLDRKRLNDYRKAGISNQAIDRLQEQTRQNLEQADAALEADNAADLIKAASGAMSREVRAYEAVRDTANDIVRAAIFLLLMLIPFSYAFERLVFAAAHVYRQIAGVAGVFTVMALVLWQYHPAFKISGQPLMIVMAFAIISMSLLVMSVIYSKFQSSLDEMHSGRAESSGARTSRLGVLTTALRLGIANMRRRKFRTALTGTTVMLITFAMLCFMSTSSYQDRREFRIADQAPFTGVLIRQPGSRTMPEAALFQLQQIVGADLPLVPRYWYNSQRTAEWRFMVRNPRNGHVEPMIAALGLAPEEDALTGIGRACPRWERFAETGGCYLSAETAKRLEVVPGETLVIGGVELELIGLIDESALEDVRRLDGESLRPLDYTQMTDEQRSEITTISVEQLTLELASGAALEPDVQLAHVPPNQLLIVPNELLKAMPGTTLRSVAVPTESMRQARRLASEMADRLAFPVYYGEPGGVNVLAATPLVPKAPKSLIIPIVIAGLIIFNTMLSSIAERRKEIYIYTSLGLAPLHVGFLFLAEALTYGLMGSIFGYIIGQGMATVLSDLGWLGGLTLNYSGTQAIFTMVMVLSVVVFSSLIPAFLAGRLATPSNEMSWKVPRPVDGVISDRLPFTVTGRTSDGVMAFLFEYLDAHREGSIGTFSTDHLHAIQTEIDGQVFEGLESTVWLAPYDLGIRQRCRILVGEAGEADVYNLHIELTRYSGQESSWWKLNRGLLADLRKQLLGWRNLKPDKMLEYITEATERLGRPSVAPGTEATGTATLATETQGS